MSGVKRDSLEETAQKAEVIVLDIEGTTTSISFVKDTLFPYVRENLEAYVKKNWNEEEFGQDLVLLREQATKDAADKVEGVVTIPEGTGEDAQKAVVSNVLWQMDLDRKTKALKQLQGHVMKDGYTSGKLVSHLYDDVATALRSWSHCGRQIYIYSSGSVDAQKLLFGHTKEGDLLELFAGHFDTEVGAKTEASSYSNIIKKIGCEAEKVIFFTDIPKEAQAARSAGLNAVLVSRPGNAPLTDDDQVQFVVVQSFLDIVFETSSKRKRMSAEEEEPVEAMDVGGSAKVSENHITIEEMEAEDDETVKCTVLSPVIEEPEEELDGASKKETKAGDAVEVVEVSEAKVEEVTQNGVESVKVVVKEIVEEADGKAEESKGSEPEGKEPNSVAANGETETGEEMDSVEEISESKSALSKGDSKKDDALESCKVESMPEEVLDKTESSDKEMKTESKIEEASNKCESKTEEMKKIESEAASNKNEAKSNTEEAELKEMDCSTLKGDEIKTESKTKESTKTESETEAKKTELETEEKNSTEENVNDANSETKLKLMDSSESKDENKTQLTEETTHKTESNTDDTRNKAESKTEETKTESTAEETTTNAESKMEETTAPAESTAAEEATNKAESKTVEVTSKAESKIEETTNKAEIKMVETINKAESKMEESMKKTEPKDGKMGNTELENGEAKDINKTESDINDKLELANETVKEKELEAEDKADSTENQPNNKPQVDYQITMECSSEKEENMETNEVKLKAYTKTEEGDSKEDKTATEMEVTAETVQEKVLPKPGEVEKKVNGKESETERTIEEISKIDSEAGGDVPKSAKSVEKTESKAVEEKADDKELIVDGELKQNKGAAEHNDVDMEVAATEKGSGSTEATRTKTEESEEKMEVEESGKEFDEVKEGIETKPSKENTKEEDDEMEVDTKTEEEAIKTDAKTTENGLANGEPESAISNGVAEEVKVQKLPAEKPIESATPEPPAVMAVES